MLRKVLVVLLIVLLAGLVATVVSCTTVPSDLGLADGRLRPCPSSPNCVNSEESGSAAIPPLEYTGDGRQAFQALLEVVRTQPRARVVTSTGDYAHVVFTTRILRFRDDLELRLDEEAEVVHVRSASRVGHSDLGANRRRVERLREVWDAARR